jgi:dipeptidyl aminopeptidase/acylaminoacyl peptidase
LTHTPSATLTGTATATSSPSATPSPSATVTLTPSPSATPTPDPYAGLTIDDLRERQYGEGTLEVTETLGSNADFARHIIRYPSDELTIYGFMNVPHGEGPFPVAVVLHGYIEPSRYNTIAYTTRYADALARAGYLVLHPNLRGYPPSDEGPNRFRVGMAVDVLNLIALLRASAGQPGPLKTANGEWIGLMGHSMGGGITLRVITVDRDVDAAILYGSMSANERTNYERVFHHWSNGTRGHEELATPEEDLRRISPATFLSEIETPLSIHHSVDDTSVPVEWSRDLHEQLQAMDHDAEYFEYEDTPHTFNGEADRLFMERMIRFFDARR